MPTSPWRTKNPEKAHQRNLIDQRKATQRARLRLDEMKAQPCMDCEGTFPPECMQFDHVRGTKKFNINTQTMLRARSVVLREMAKCDLVCANCHAIRTRKQMLKKGRRIRRITDIGVRRALSSLTN